MSIFTAGVIIYAVYHQRCWKRGFIVTCVYGICPNRLAREHLLRLQCSLKWPSWEQLTSQQVCYSHPPPHLNAQDSVKLACLSPVCPLKHRWDTLEEAYLTRSGCVGVIWANKLDIVPTVLIHGRRHRVLTVGINVASYITKYRTLAH